MREVKDFKGTLPLGFRLMDDEDFVVLFFEDKEVARFYHSADPKEIEKAAEHHLEGLQPVR